jgi:hypothetical protein
MFHIARNARADYFRRRAAVELKDEGIDAATDARGPAPGGEVIAALLDLSSASPAAAS